ncbi:hypothetical protein EZJ58_0893 [Sodalis ligni]|uniref:Uncharacterized protein n=1 Tax=Sodalis ligni TaxID=2697027 RepID=A0A4R1N6K0_9GAMM|nr:hypothetical protein EZJ58_0893 [Sodalis ligni]
MESPEYPRRVDKADSGQDGFSLLSGMVGRLGGRDYYLYV